MLPYATVTSNPLLGLLAAILPAQEREALVRRGAEPLPWSVVLGIAELFLGVLLMVADASAYFRPLADAMAEQVVEMHPNELRGRPEVGLGGAVIWLAWMTEPYTWFLASVAIVGVVRLIAAGLSREAVGEPFVWLGVRIVQGVQRLLRGSRDKLRYGPQRPDRVIRDEPEGDLVVLSWQPKPDWNELVTIEIDESFYRLRRTEERQDGTWWAYAYVLRKAPENEIIRGLIRYIPPRGVYPGRG